MVVHHRRVLDQVFTGSADGRDMDAQPVPGDSLFDAILRIIVIETPEMCGVVQCRFPVQHAEIDRLRGLSRDDDAVIAGVAQGRPPVAAAVGLARQPGGR